MIPAMQGGRAAEKLAEGVVAHGPRRGAPRSIGLSAVITAAATHDPRVLTIRVEGADALPSGPLEAEHRTLEIGLRNWVERQTSERLGYVEQLYTFGDRDRVSAGMAAPALIVAYLALVREAAPAGAADAAWQSWYRYFPWEDWRDGRPALLAPIEERLGRWAAGAQTDAQRRMREERIGLAFGLGGASWNEELVLERYELFYEAGLVAEAGRDLGHPAHLAKGGGDDGIASGHVAPHHIDGAAGVAMAVDHRRILATAIGRLRGKIKYRPVVFELMPPAFTLLQLQRTVEALSGVRLHKQNFRRLVEQQGLVEETGSMSAATGGRPARLVRFRREVLLERPAPGLRLRAGRRAS